MVPTAADLVPFSIVLVPDTQYYTSKQGNGEENTYWKQMRWIRDHRETENILMAVHLGDITGSNEPEQWEIASAAHRILDQADLPYSVVPGNHDYLGKSSASFRSRTFFDSHFPASRFSGRAWFGGSLGSSNVNNYTLFENGAQKFLVLSLEYAPRKDTLCLAEDLLARHPDRRVIVATHCYLTKGGAYAEGCPNPDYGTVGAAGETVWDEFVSRYSSIFLVVSGHVNESAHAPRTGNAGNTVQQLVVDYQAEAACNAKSPDQCNDHCKAGTYTGNGWLRQLVFDPAVGQVQARTFSVEDGNTSVFPGGHPVLFCSELNKQGNDDYPSDPLAPDHAFSFTYEPLWTKPFVREDLGRRSFLDRTVNSVGEGQQERPAVAMAENGDFVAVWEDDSSKADGAGNRDIFLRGFLAGGCQKFPAQVINGNQNGQQRHPAVAVDRDGRAVVVWEDDTDGNGVFQVKARGFHADGSERLPVFTVNSEASGQQRNPAIGMSSDGRFVVAWEDVAGGNGAQILVRGFNADGSPLFPDRSGHTDTAGQHLEPTVALDASGAFVVAWQDDTDGNGYYQIHARGFDSAGKERFPKIVVNSVDTGQQYRPSLSLDQAGHFVVVWEDDQDKDGNSNLLARGFNADGTARFSDFAVVAGAGTHAAPSLAAGTDGSFVVAWQDDGDGNGTSQIHAKAFRADGSEWQARWTVNLQSAGQQLSPSVALAGKTLVVAWQDDLDGNEVYQILARGVDLP
ncbi:MAG: hypothetical protein A2284_00320 [Deltaproteobacteria bacterium RIFOXYA12_FULL_61_11]|nr:MAG: hypothetical protein A2284_00320 [Deltaproteobacteria bacterium RIFOXYA12_FULL_61_11]